MNPSAVHVPVLYEDNHLLVVVKPVGMPVQADQSGALDLLTHCKAGIKARYQKPGNVFLGLVHRLDRPVGGVMVFARTSKAAARLSAQIRERTFEKTYLARVNGCPEPKKARLVHHLYKDTGRNTVTCVPPDHPESREAILDYEVLSTAEGVSEVQINLLTGRPHQIRVQLAAIGCPLVGDRKYGHSQVDPPIEGPALWSYRLGFQHPTQPKAVHFAVPPPWGAR